MLIFTGDLHGDIDISKLSTTHFPQQKTLTRGDFLIIAGDFGLIWNNSSCEKYWLKWLDSKPFTTLFVCGNHENFNLLKKYPVEEKFGGKVHKISNNIFHLMRGQVFTLDGKKIFTMGGASSPDKEFRKENVSWWKEELPSREEYDEAISNLEKANWEVDIVVTHAAPASVVKLINFSYELDALNLFLEEIRQRLKFKKWYFGHYHKDITINREFIALYNSITLYSEIQFLV